MIFTEQALFEWSEDYCIGVKSIDDAHKQLFSIVSRIIRNFMDNNFEKNKMTCIEAIKYLKSYTIKHFADEEAYQLSIGYSGYKMHKKIHDNMRDVVVPALERDVTASGYSMESMEHFVGACAGWLMAHVMVEDQAITGKTQSRWKQNPDDDGADILEHIVRDVTGGLIQTPATLVSKNYTGYELNKLFCYSEDFTDRFGTVYTVTNAIEEVMVENVVSKIMNKSVFELIEVMQSMIEEITRSLNIKIMEAFLSEPLKSTAGRFVKSKDFYAGFEKVCPDYSLLFRTMYGYMAFCVTKKPVVQL
ncbi:MAG: hemerythrin domain-containing protein [Prevotella sp.]|nr:hemerythrin domain-containing protein [Prevotella sp.]